MTTEIELNGDDFTIINPLIIPNLASKPCKSGPLVGFAWVGSQTDPHPAGTRFIIGAGRPWYTTKYLALEPDGRVVTCTNDGTFTNSVQTLSKEYIEDYIAKGHWMEVNSYDVAVGCMDASTLLRSEQGNRYFVRNRESRHIIENPKVSRVWIYRRNPKTPSGGKTKFHMYFVNYNKEKKSSNFKDLGSMLDQCSDSPEQGYREISYKTYLHIRKAFEPAGLIPPLPPFDTP